MRFILRIQAAISMPKAMKRDRRQENLENKLSKEFVREWLMEMASKVWMVSRCLRCLKSLLLPLLERYITYVDREHFVPADSSNMEGRNWLM